MVRRLKVSPADLRASAHAADGIAQDMKGPNDKAVRETGCAAEAMAGWTVGAAIRGVAGGWRPALHGLHHRVAVGAANLRKSADGHDWNEDLVFRDFERLPA